MLQKAQKSSRVEPVLINKADRLGGPSHQLSTTPPRLLCAVAIVGLGLRAGPLHTKFKRVEMELLHLFRSRFLHSPGCPPYHSSI